MSVVRSLNLLCDRGGCGSQFYGQRHVWVEGPVRSEAGHEGWKYVNGKDICPQCVADANSCRVGEGRP